MSWPTFQLAAGFPPPLGSYPPPEGGLLHVLAGRVRAEPFNLVPTAIFFLAVVHTFLTPLFRRWAHRVESRHKAHGRPAPVDDDGNEVPEVSFAGQLLHFLGEVEAVFGAWALVLLVAIALHAGWSTAVDYIGHRVDFSEPMFVMVIMALASSRPMLRFAERCLQLFAALGGGTVGAWWTAILIIGPLFGSFITEPGAMTISALLLARQFYHYGPSPKLAYATIGLLFVNVSVGGMLTNFAAPPVVMAAGPWHWDLVYVFAHFGWKAFAGIVTSTLLYFFHFRHEFAALDRVHLRLGRAQTQGGGAAIPPWIMLVQVGFMAFVVSVAHTPALFVGGFLFFLAFAQATAHHQKRLDLRPPLLVGFFLAGLVVHGSLQSWWLEPVLKSLGRIPLFVGATILTGFNDNAAITYLATLVPGFTEGFKYAVMAGAVTGGGLTVMANAPNPAGQSILQRYFPDGVSPLWLAVAALLPTLIMSAVFMLL
ncbi:MAG TPA: putative Na+/H+ antiporter [Opitutaceae bacterium]|nr:putative Na+/H+ antiporter [Opitutaceae bacterium]